MLGNVVRCGRRAGRRSAGTLVLALPALTLAGCLAPAPEAPRAPERTLTQALAVKDTTGFARAYAPRPFEFPQDHGPHPQYKHEWWYVTGNLETAEGRRFGFQLTFFRIALAAQTRAGSSAWGTNQIYMGHFALSDVGARRFRSAERFSRGAAGLAGAAAEPFRVWLEDWSIEAAQSGALGREDIALRLRARAEGDAIELHAEGVKPLVLQGERGLSRKSETAGNASYYYSVTRLHTHGFVEVGGERVRVQGLSWLDREWSTSALDEQQVGWDWFALQLTDGRDLMFYRLRRRDGGTDPLSGGTLVHADGTTRALARADVELEIEDYWRSPRTRVRYPARWRLRVPGADLDLRIRPYLADQEFDLSVRYWEGAVAVVGTGAEGPLRGSGYVELVGYERSPQRP